MLEAIGSAALRTILLASTVELCLRLLRIRHPQLLLAAWTAVLAASLAMPILQNCVPINVPAATELPLSFTGSPPPKARRRKPRHPLHLRLGPIHAAPDWQLRLTGIYFAVTGTMLLRLLVGLVLSWDLLRAARPVRDGWATGDRVRASAAIAAPVTIGSSILLPADCRNGPSPHSEPFWRMSGPTWPAAISICCSCLR